MIFIGDIHGGWTYYLQLIQNITHTPTVQVGDLAIGFAGYPHPQKIEGNHWFIRGNHDNPHEIRKHPNYLGDFGYREDWDLFYVGGADSIDKQWRTIGVNWWPEEEIDYYTLAEIVIPMFKEKRPKMVVTHTCPETITKELQKVLNNGWNNPPTTRTEHALQLMFEAHQPDVWVFGHFHHAWELRRDGTRFICVNSQQMIEIE